MSNSLRYYRKKAGLSQEAAAAAIHADRQTIMRLESGKTELSMARANELATLYDCSVAQLFGLAGESDKPRMVAVVGFVGAGEIIFSVDDHAMGAGLEEVDCPPGADPSKVVAVRVKGDSMLPKYEDGDILYYSRDRDGVPSSCLNKVCVVKRADDGVQVKEVRKGSKLGHYHLISRNPAVEPQFDVPLEWAAKVLFVKSE